MDSNYYNSSRCRPGYKVPLIVLSSFVLFVHDAVGEYWSYSRRIYPVPLLGDKKLSFLPSHLQQHRHMKYLVFLLCRLQFRQVYAPVAHPQLEHRQTHVLPSFDHQYKMLFQARLNHFLRQAQSSGENPWQGDKHKCPLLFPPFL